MSLYKQLLIDIMYSLRQENSNLEYASVLEFMDRQKLSIDYQITETLIDIVFEILKGEVIKFDPDLRTHKDFLEVKEQISQSESLVDDLDPIIRSEEFEKIEDPIIRRIIIEQELLAQHQVKSSHSRSTLLFLHLMFLSFPEIRNNSIMTNRKQVLLNLFGQSTYKYQFTESDNEPKNKDKVQIQVIEVQKSQDIREYNFKQTQTEFQPETLQSNVIKFTQIPEYNFYFSCQVPIEIEQLSSYSIRMTFSKANQSVYRWSELDRSSYFNLIITHSKAFDYWKNMLKLLNQRLFQAFINDQIVDCESDDVIANDMNQIDQFFMDNNSGLNNLIRMDNGQFCVKIQNKVIIVESNRLCQTLQSIDKEKKILNKLIMQKDQMNCQIQQLQKEIHINYTLEEWQQREKQLENRNIQVYTQQTLKKLNVSIQQRPTISKQIRKIFEYVSTNQAAQNKLDQAHIQKDPHKIIEAVKIIQDSEVNNDENACAHCTIPVQKPFVYVEGQHIGEWIFDKQYPQNIVKLTNERLCLIMKNNSQFIVQWWQFNYKTLKNLFVEEGTKESAYIWSVMLILTDEDQFFKLWKGEVIKQYTNEREEEDFEKSGLYQEKFKSEQNLTRTYQTEIPEIIIKNDHYRFILKFKNNVQILTQSEFEQYKTNTQSHYFKEHTNWQIYGREIFYNRKLKLFQQLFLQEQKFQSQIKVPQAIKSNKVRQNQSALSQSIKYIYEDYPTRIDLVGKDSLKLQFKNSIKNTVMKWKQLEYKSLIQLIDDKINIKAGETWSNMLILLDHDQFYKLWKEYHYYQHQSDELIIRQKRNETQQESRVKGKFFIQVDKQRSPPNQIIQRIVKLDQTRLIVKFDNFVQILTQAEAKNYMDVLEIPESEFNQLKIKFSTAFYKQNIKAFQQRLQKKTSSIDKYKSIYFKQVKVIVKKLYFQQLIF